MKTHSPKLFIPLLLALFTLVSQATAAPKFTVEGDLTGTFTISPPTIVAPGEFTVVITVSGNLSNLGHVQALVVGKVQVATNLSATPIPPTTAVIVTDLGETITVRLHWEGEQTLVTGVYDLAGDGEVIGGTGRFKDAKGTGLGTGSLSLATGTATLSLSGNLTGVKKKPGKE